MSPALISTAFDEKSGGGILYSRSSVCNSKATVQNNLEGEKRYFKVASWYDNKWGYASRVVNLVHYLHLRDTIKRNRKTRNRSVSPMDNEKYFHDYLNRCIPLLTEKGVKKLRDATVAVAGCGGAGGASAITLARMGVGKFKLADPGVFDAPDINRQWAANIPNLGRNKTEGYEDALLAINPDIEVKKYEEGVTGTNIVDFLEGADLLIDCLDISVSASLMSRMHEQARQQKIYSAASIILGFGAICYCSSPFGMPMERLVRMLDSGTAESKFPSILRTVFMPQHLDIIEKKIPTHKLPSVPISCMVAAAVLSTEIILILLGKLLPGARKPVCLPRLIIADFLRLSYQVVDIDSIPLE